MLRSFSGVGGELSRSDMTHITKFAFVFFTALFLAACAGRGAFQTVQRSDQDVTRLMTVNDKLIVPGERVGPVFFGMTEAQLYQKMGNPNRSFPANDGALIVYEWGDLVANVQLSTHTVVQMQVMGPSYGTAEGVSTGTPELAVKAKLGQPSWERLAYADRATLKFCYNSGLNSGLTAYVDEGRVTWFAMNPRGLCS
jgi:hypothetical protein